MVEPPPLPVPADPPPADIDSRAVEVEYLRRDQRAQIYKAVPNEVEEIDSFFYDSDGHCIWQDVNRRRDPEYGLRYKTLPRKLTKLWPLVKRIKVFSTTQEMPISDGSASGPEGSLPLKTVSYTHLTLPTICSV